MPTEPMTLLERLRNPAWACKGDDTDAVLDTKRTVADMREAADLIECLEASQPSTPESLAASVKLPYRPTSFTVKQLRKAVAKLLAGAISDG